MSRRREAGSVHGLEVDMRVQAAQLLQVPRVGQHVGGEFKLAEARLAGQQLRHVCGRGMGVQGEEGLGWESSTPPPGLGEQPVQRTAAMPPQRSAVSPQSC